jgi:hypothetical protein
VLNIVLPENITPETMPSESDVLELEKKYTFLREGGLGRNIITYYYDPFKLIKINYNDGKI